MTPERWQQIRAVYEQAASLSASERAAYLNQACTSDPELREEVESLLKYEARAESAFLQTPAANLLPPLPEKEKPPSRIGRRVGVYEIVAEIGHGGMGEVYRAARADGHYDQQVAVKLVRGGFDSRFVFERFLNERQILATLDHANIARLLDGGTTEDGIPYLVMELIDGVRIDDYCQNHKLSVTERLQLFRQVCAAVSYAHQRLVIHRDLKPSNILVTDKGIPKLLDFGIAKMLDPAAGAELTMARPMTPEYASPEQIRGEAITTASDVYSLGMVLYQLLTGRSPYRVTAHTPHELSRAITETEPQRPSTVVLKPASVPQTKPSSEPHPVELPTRSREGSPAKLRKRLLGDVDNILLKALRKEPTRRYPSVEQFAEDIRRHLEGLPVTAAKDSWRYRAGKFIRRHRAGVIATACALLALIVGVGLIVREDRIARAERERADQRFNDVRKLANSLIFELHDSIRDLPGSTPARKLLVTRALEYLDSLARQAKGDTSLQRELATAYEKVGDVLGYPYAANLGDIPGALQSYRKALVIRESLANARPNDKQLQGELVRNYFRIANALESAGDFKEALETVSKALPITQKMAEGANDPVLADHLAGSYYYTAGLLGSTGDPLGAMENYRRAAAVREAALQSNPTNLSLNTHLAADYIGIAQSMKQTGDLTRAIEMQAKAVATMEQISRTYPNNITLREFLAEAINRMGTFRQIQGNSSAALETFRHAHKIFQELLAADPKNHLAKTNVGFSDDGIAASLLNMGKIASAVQVFREAIATFESMSPATSSDRNVRSGLATAYSGLGNVYSALAVKPHTNAGQARERWREARAWYEKSNALWINKDKRGELESDEREELRKVSEAIAKCNAALQGATTVSQIP